MTNAEVHVFDGSTELEHPQYEKTGPLFTPGLDILMLAGGGSQLSTQHWKLPRLSA